MSPTQRNVIYLISGLAISIAAVLLVRRYVGKHWVDIGHSISRTKSNVRRLGERMWGRTKRTATNHVDNLIHTERTPQYSPGT